MLSQMPGTPTSSYKGCISGGGDQALGATRAKQRQSPELEFALARWLWLPVSPVPGDRAAHHCSARKTSTAHRVVSAPGRSFDEKDETAGHVFLRLRMGAKDHKAILRPRRTQILRVLSESFHFCHVSQSARNHVWEWPAREQE